MGASELNTLSLCAPYLQHEAPIARECAWHTAQLRAQCGDDDNPVGLTGDEAKRLKLPGAWGGRRGNATLFAWSFPGKG